jgi:SNF2 family DNA or RNA helicase
MTLPSALSHFAKFGETLYQKKAVKELLFSSSTYQVSVKDNKEIFWPFLQFDGSELKDFFCTCPTSEKKGACPHLVAAYLAIFAGKKSPHHLRFKKSLVYKLCLLFAELTSLQVERVKWNMQPMSFSLNTASNCSLSIEVETALEKKNLTALLSGNKTAEERSFRLAALSEQLREDYLEGAAPFEVQFIFSFWSDLAKMLFWKEEKKGCHFSFAEIEGVPLQYQFTCNHFRCLFQITTKYLPELIPYFHKENLRVHTKMHQLEKITYDQEDKSFTLHASQKREKQNQGKIIGPWIYISGQGFYRRADHSFLSKEEISKEEISSFLSKYQDIVQHHIDGTTFQVDPQPLSYELSFDDAKNLHVVTFLQEKGDLERPLSFFDPPWCYLPEKGFFKVEEPLFSSFHHVVSPKDMSEFLQRYRLFLHDYPGFEVHFGSIESDISYFVNAEGDLRFSSRLHFNGHNGLITFDDWIYVKGEGFYPRREKKELSFIREDLVIEKKRVSHFVSQYYSKLQLLPGFFTDFSPFEKVGLKIDVKEDRLYVHPKRVLKKEVTWEEVILYEDYVYIKSKGFFLLPGHFRLPKRYQKEVLIAINRESYFVQVEWERLQPFIIEVAPQAQKPSHLMLQIKDVKMEKVKKKIRIQAHLVYLSDIGEAELYQIWESYGKKRQVCFSDAGLISFKEDRFNWLKMLTKRKFHRITRYLKMSLAEWLRLSLWEEIKIPRDHQEYDKITKTLENFTSSERIPPFDLTGLLSVLRPYQEIGFKWLWFLYCHGLSGLLCDDMGLGKTHQAMSIVAALHNEDRQNKFLVICPTSVIYHWQNLLQTFVPHMKVLSYHGVERTLSSFHKEYDILLTSYGILRTGKEKIEDIPFALAIFDEVQIAKNPKSQTHYFLSQIRAAMRLGLTGTPIENSLLELKAIFDLILPNYMPTLPEFKEKFIDPIEKKKDVKQRKILQKMIQPFILRRKKSEVLLDLPEKTEEIAYCDLSLEQKELYQSISRSFYTQLAPSLQDDTKPMPYMHIFSLLSKLKQVCDHPSLIHQNITNYQEHKSGKFALFIQLLSEARASNQKVVVFSQYLGMLSIIEKYLKEHRIGYTKLTGETKKRKEALESFRDNPKCEVFLASLLAAGVGIDLSAGSVVIHYDRWWNPAKENQATDRVHRLGQSRGVQVFKCVAKGTIEEEIHRLIEKKQGLIEEMIGRDEMDQIKILTRQELADILQKTIRF